MMQKLQKFGAAMFVPVLLFSFAGIVVALTSLFNNPLIFGSLANTNTFWYGLWDTTPFNKVAGPSLTKLICSSWSACQSGWLRRPTGGQPWKPSLPTGLSTTLSLVS